MQGKVMKHISMTSQSCSACTACISVCPKSAILFSVDEEGFKVPVVDEKLCVDCGLCIKICPALNTKDSVNDISSKAYALQYHDEAVRNRSASGALFPAFANYFINTLHGYVCGCVLDENLMPRHIVSKQWKDVERMQDSKYVQSDMGICFSKIMTLLKAEEYVLFSGTSCQVKGLYSALETKRICTDRLLTIDFFCHGVPSPKIWSDYLRYVQQRLGFKAEGYRFRNKTYGWGKGTQSRGTGYLSTWKYLGIWHEVPSLVARIWPRIFFSNLCLRRYCHTCPYTKVEKPADITMGDFWGVENFRPDFDDHKGCSMAIVHSRKAEKIINALPNTEILDVSIDEVIKRQGNAFAPSKPHAQRKSFWKDYADKGFPFVLQKYFYYSTVGIIKASIKYMLFKLHLKKYSY